MPLVHWAMPAKYHSVHKNDLARAMVSQSELSFQSIGRSGESRPEAKVLEFGQMQPFFVKGDAG